MNREQVQDMFEQRLANNINAIKSDTNIKEAKKDKAIATAIAVNESIIQSLCINKKIKDKLVWRIKTLRERREEFRARKGIM